MSTRQIELLSFPEDKKCRVSANVICHLTNMIDLDTSTVSACVMCSFVTFSYRVSKNDSTK